MGTMTSSLPAMPYRLAPYTQAQPQSYNAIAGPSSNITNQMAMTPYGSQGNTSAWIGHQQHWFTPQHIGSQHTGQYYGHPISPSPQVSLPHRPEYGYHTNGVFVGQQPHLNAHYYYPPGGSFAGQAPQAHGQTVPEHYATPGAQLGATRSVQPQYGAQVASNSDSVGQTNGMLMFAHVFVERLFSDCAIGSLDGRHSLVRGPPRKPKQSGKFPMASSESVWLRSG